MRNSDASNIFFCLRDLRKTYARLILYTWTLSLPYTNHWINRFITYPVNLPRTNYTKESKRTPAAAGGNGVEKLRKTARPDLSGSNTKRRKKDSQ